MRIKGNIKIYILTLICLLTLGILSQYIPHHHHEGKICVEQNDEFTHSSDSHNDCHLERPNIEYKGISKTNQSQIPNSTFLTLLFLVAFSDDSDATPKYTDRCQITACKTYSVKSHKLRGSPLFS